MMERLEIAKKYSRKRCKGEIRTDEPATDAVCFHMQQCVEKYLKVYIIFNGKEIRKSHDIAELIESYSDDQYWSSQ